MVKASIYNLWESRGTISWRHGPAGLLCPLGSLKFWHYLEWNWQGNWEPRLSLYNWSWWESKDGKSPEFHIWKMITRAFFVMATDRSGFMTTLRQSKWHQQPFHLNFSNWWCFPLSRTMRRKIPPLNTDVLDANKTQRCDAQRKRWSRKRGSPFLFFLFSSAGYHSAQQSRAAILLSGHKPELPTVRS